MHPLGRHFRRPCVFRRIVEPFPRACASAPSSDVAVFAQLLQCCTSASAAEHRACHHLQVVNPARCRASSRVEAAVRVGLADCSASVVNWNCMLRTELPWALCLFQCGLLCADCVADVGSRSASCYARMSFTKVGRGQGATMCAVFGGFVLRPRAESQHEADVPLRLSVSSPTAWHVSTMYDVEGSLRRHLAFDKTSLVGAWPLTRSAPGVHCLVRSGGTARCGSPGSTHVGAKRADAHRQVHMLPQDEYLYGGSRGSVPIRRRCVRSGVTLTGRSPPRSPMMVVPPQTRPHPGPPAKTAKWCDTYRALEWGWFSALPALAALFGFRCFTCVFTLLQPGCMLG